jgi:site-specific recombinase XerD
MERAASSHSMAIRPGPCGELPYPYDALSSTLPIILRPEEIVRFLGCVANVKQRTILTTCYAAGLRISEAVHLMPSAIDPTADGHPY